MSQRNSEYARIDGDTYVTPRWVYEALYSVEPWAEKAWDCAPPHADFDFLKLEIVKKQDIATNPPFGLANEFLHLALRCADRVAMLLPHAWDTAQSRRPFFTLSPFKAKYTIVKRIRWENLEQKKNGPSTNHSWYVWDWTYDGKPFMGWLP